VAYKEKPSMDVFFSEWYSLYESKSGERGMFNRQAAERQVDKNGRRTNYSDEAQTKKIRWGTNPCSEIILRPYQFCNLSEVVVRAEDTIESLKGKVAQATMLGTFQSCLTDFKYLRSIWKKNTEEERLLGVSLTGIMDNELTNGKLGKEKLESTLRVLREVAVEVNKEVSQMLGINQSAAITCVKPSGTVSQLVDSASGIHARHNPYYIRTVRADNKDPMTEFLKDAGVPAEPDFMRPESATVFSFPVKSPDKAVCRNDMTALEHLELWLSYQEHWCEHKPSITVSVREEEWLQVGDWVFNNFDTISGISFLPHSDHSYKQAPYQDCDTANYLLLAEAMPENLDWSLLREYEREDNTTGSQELACTAGVCEVVDITSR
jgi:ribonucleoside-triphosphate reductase (thioredoxin)